MNFGTNHSDSDGFANVSICLEQITEQSKTHAGDLLLFGIADNVTDACFRWVSIFAHDRNKMMHIGKGNATGVFRRYLSFEKEF